jgi:hypothetical protein
MNTSVRTGPSFGEKSVKITGLEGSADTTGLGPTYPPSSLQLAAPIPIANNVIIAIDNNFLLIFLCISVNFRIKLFKINVIKVTFLFFC